MCLKDTIRDLSGDKIDQTERDVIATSLKCQTKVCLKFLAGLHDMYFIFKL